MPPELLLRTENLLAVLILAIQSRPEKVESGLASVLVPEVLHGRQELLIEALVHQPRIMQRRNTNVDVESAGIIHFLRIVSSQPLFTFFQGRKRRVRHFSSRGGVNTLD